MFCKLAIVSIAWSVSTVVFVFSSLVIAADMFRAVLFSMKSALLTRNKRRLIIASTWIASVALFTYFLYAPNVVPRHDTGRYCIFQWELTSHTRKCFR